MSFLQIARAGSFFNVLLNNISAHMNGHDHVTMHFEVRMSWANLFDSLVTRSEKSNSVIGNKDRLFCFQ